jgi:hypothetical protein
MRLVAVAAKEMFIGSRYLSARQEDAARLEFGDRAALAPQEEQILMRRHLRSGFLLVVLAAAVSCQKGPESSPALPPPVPAAPVVMTAAPSAEGPATTPTPAAPPAEYPVCGGQKLAAPAPAARAGAVSAQLAPAFLDEMSACRPEDAPPADLIAHTTDGSINEKGDCLFASSGVSCHYHSGSEFVANGSAKQTPGQGELHCIFPSSDAKSPRVFGGPVVCRDPTQGKASAEPGKHEIKAGASCPAALLQELTHCASSRCCDDGTLTNPIADLVRDSRNDIRPDFRICAETLTIDCELLANLTAHDANSPALGGVAKPVFVLKHPTHSKKVAAHAP